MNLNRVVAGDILDVMKVNNIIDEINNGWSVTGQWWEPNGSYVTSDPNVSIAKSNTGIYVVSYSGLGLTDSPVFTSQSYNDPDNVITVASTSNVQTIFHTHDVGQSAWAIQNTSFWFKMAKGPGDRV